MRIQCISGAQCVQWFEAAWRRMSGLVPRSTYALGFVLNLASAAGSEEEIQAVFRRVRDEIDTKVKAWVAEQGILILDQAAM
jgi:hypothetical protein